MPRNVSTESLRDYKDAAGNEKVWYSVWSWQSNPYWRAHENRNEDIRDRFIGATQMQYKITDWLSVQGRTGMDFFLERRNARTATGSFDNLTGGYSEQWMKALEHNSDFLIAFNKKWGDDLQLSANLGGNTMTRSYEEIFSSAGRLAIPHFYDINNSLEPPTVTDFRSKERINSLYGSAQFGFRNYLYLDVTGRNDWSSTLPQGNNSYFYPSGNVSFVFSEVLPQKSKFFDFGKVRASVASVGSDGDPYMLAQRYTSTGNYNSNPTYSVVSVRPNPDLKPETTFSLEAGMDLRFLKNRLRLDFTYYNSVTRNQIIEADVAPSSGYAKAVINAGKIQNQGVEIQLNITPVKTTNFSWNSTLNFTKNISKVVELAEGLETFPLGEHWRVFVEARPGNPYGDIVTYATAKDENGNRLVDSTGLYVQDSNLSVVGNYNPKFLMGWQNEFKYKNFFLSFLVDMRYGGEMYAASNMYAMGYSGTVEQTLPGREEWYASEAAREAAGMEPEEWTATGGYLAEGVYAPGTMINDVDVSGQTNAVYVNPEDYWGQFSEWGNELPEPHVYDASYIKLREISFGYQFPTEIAQKLKLGGLSVSFVGRNVWIIWKKVPNIDPESAYSNGNAQGLEYASFPGTRSLGINLNLKF